MSKSAAPQQKPNFLSTFLFAMMLFFGIQLLMNRNQAPQVPEGDLYQKLRAQNRDRMDVSIVHTASAYNNQLDADVKAKKLTQAEADKKKIESSILVANTQLKAGLHSNQTTRVRDAFYSVVGLERKHLGKPEWNTPVEVTNIDGTPEAVTGQQLYDQIRSELEVRNKRDLVWGLFPGYQLIDGLVALTGRVPGFSYAFAAFLLAFLVRGLVYPLSQRQIMYGRQMSQLAPLVKEIKDRYKDDQMTQNQKVMELYKEYGVNPMAGCGPMVIQMPLFFMIYQCMLHYQFTFEKGTFLWINPQNAVNTNGFIAANLGQMDMILTIIYGISMLVSTLLQPVSDPSQIRQQRLMGAAMSIIVTFFMFTGAVPVVSAFVLYWTFTNMLATAQSLRAYRLPLTPLQKVNAKGGGVYPQKGIMGKWQQRFEDLQKQAMEQQGKTPNNGKGPNGSGVTFLGTGETKTGTPAKHKPKKRK